MGERHTPVGAGETVRLAVWGTNGGCTIPVAATGIAASVTVVSPSSGSYLTVFAADVARPNTSNLNYTPGQGPVSNAVTASLSADGNIDVYNHQGSVDVIIDINGYYVPSASGPAGSTGSVGSAGPVSASCIALIRWDTCNKPTATVPVGTYPWGVAFDGTNIWVANSDSGTVSKIDPVSTLVTATVTVGTGPYSVAFDGTNIWVANSDSGTVSKINPVSNAVTATVNVGSYPRGVAFDGTNIWVTNSGTGTVSKIRV